MKPGVHDFTIYQGSKLSKTFQWQQGTAPPTPVALTGYTARCQFRSSIASSTVIDTLDTTNGGIVLDAPNGKITLVRASTLTAAYTFDKAVYDIELIPPTGEADAFRFVQGTITLDKEVTRP